MWNSKFKFKTHIFLSVYLAYPNYWDVMRYKERQNERLINNASDYGIPELGRHIVKNVTC